MKIVLVGHIYNPKLFEIKGNFLVTKGGLYWFEDGDHIEIIDTTKNSHKIFTVSEQNGVGIRVNSAWQRLLGSPRQCYNKICIG